MKRWLAVLGVGLMVLLGPWTVAQADHLKADFALFTEEPTVADQNVICSCVNPVGKPMGCQIKITMGNRADLGGVAGFFRTTYNDLDFVDYPLPTGTTVNITLASGQLADRAVKVSGDGTGGSVLVGQMSAESAHEPRCCTTPAGAADCQTFPIP